jgi:hypothetical protein
MELLQLVALDAEDLGVISTHLQDAVIRAGDLTYLRAQARFALVARRFDWEASPREAPRRRLAGLHFDRVTAVRAKGIARDADDAALALLAVTFAPGEAPSGTITLVFAGGAEIALAVECIEAQLKDLGPVWQAGSRPGHAAPGEP